MDYTDTTKQETINKLNNYFIWFIATVIFYGAFRKWFLPGLSSIIYFAPDIFIVYIYYYAIKNRLFPVKNLDKLFYIIFIGLLFLAIIQGLIYGSVIVTIFGWRNYCLILPMVVLMYTYLDEKSLNKLSVFFCYVAIPTGILVFVQSNSPMDSFINRSVGEGANQRIFVVVKDVVRTTGFFSFNTGHSLFTFGALGLFIFQLFRKEDRLSIWILIATGVSILVSVVVSGSRGNFVVTGLGCCVFIISQLGTIKYKRSFYTLFVAVFVLIIGYLFVTLFLSNKIDNINERFETGDSFETRISGLFSLIDKPFYVNLPYLGYGLGISSPGAKAGLGEAMAIDFAFEHEWSRFMVECGIVIGITLILFRIFLACLMVRNGVKAFLVSRNPGTIVLVSVFFTTLLIGQMSMNALTMHFGWFFFAVITAMYRVYVVEQNQDLKLQEEDKENG